MDAFWGWDCYGPGRRPRARVRRARRAEAGVARLKHAPELGGLTSRDQDAFVSLVRMFSSGHAGVAIRLTVLAALGGPGTLFVLLQPHDGRVTRHLRASHFAHAHNIAPLRVG